MISAYAKRLALPYIDDPTNDSGDNVRSGLRRDIMPVLVTYNPNVIDNIARSAQLLGDAQATVNAQAEQDMQQTADKNLQLPAAQRVLNIDALQALPLYRQRQLLHHWLGQDEPLPPAKQLVDDVWNLTQRSDHDHQTELFWQGRTHSYTVRRYRQQLYRLSNEWLSWLDRPMIEQTQPLSRLDLTTSDSAYGNFVLLTVRRSDEYIWQLQVYPDTLARLLESHIDETAFDAVLKIKPLNRKQRVQTALATRPQAGKKLYQTLGIPLWLRESLVVVSVVLLDKEHAENEIPILLLSPFDRWILKNDFSINTKSLGSDIDDVFKNILRQTE